MSSEVSTVVAVAGGGVIGATARWAVAVGVAPTDTQAFPLHTFGVNVIGCFLIGVAAAHLTRPSIGWAFAVTGVLGGFTTMSSLAVEANRFADADRRVVAVSYLVLTLLAGFAALRMAEALTGQRRNLPVGVDEPEGIE